MGENLISYSTVVSSCLISVDPPIEHLVESTEKAISDNYSNSQGTGRIDEAEKGSSEDAPSNCWSVRMNDNDPLRLFFLNRKEEVTRAQSEKSTTSK